MKDNRCPAFSPFHSPHAKLNPYILFYFDEFYPSPLLNKLSFFVQTISKWYIMVVKLCKTLIKPAMVNDITKNL